MTEEALNWLGDPEIQPSIVVSAALLTLLGDPEVIDEWRQFGNQPNPDQLGRLLDALHSDAIAKFSHLDRPEVSERAHAIRTELLVDGPFGEVFADEWIFLTTQSMGVMSADARRTVEAFTRAGGRVYELTNDQIDRGLRAIRSRLPARLVARLKRVGRFPFRSAPKLLCFGGTLAGFLVPAVGLGAGVLGLVQQGAAIIAGDP